MPANGEPLNTLKTITFVYDSREDRIRGAINGSGPEAWSCWVTRRLSLAWLAKAGEFLASTSPLAQRAPAEHRSDLASFEREAAMAQTAQAMSPTPPEIIAAPPPVEAELLEKVTWTQRGERFHFELVGNRGGGAAGMLSRAELQRIMQMLQEVAGKAGWTAVPAASQGTATPTSPPDSPIRH